MKSQFYLAFLLIFSILSLSATNYYSDPTTAGKMTNTGTAASPWGSLNAIFAAGKTFIAGDTIFLKTGNHGYAVVKGSNAGFVVITPAPGHSPIVERMRIGNGTNQTDYWKLENLTVQSESTLMGSETGIWLIDIYPKSTHITISNCIICSSNNTTDWTRDDWRTRCNSGISSRFGLNAFHIIENNEIRNTALGIEIGASNSTVRNNLVQNFTHDASRILGSNIVFEQNKLFDLIKVMMYNENHDDMLQAFTTPTYNLGTDTLKNVTVRNNIFINTTDTTRSYRGAAQGIGLFNGPYFNWNIENNIVMNDHWHGITISGGANCKIINNTVLDPYISTPIDPFDLNDPTTGPNWIKVDSLTGCPSSGNLIINNLVAKSIVVAYPKLASSSHNIIMGGTMANYAQFFKDVFNPAFPLNFDLRLKPGSSAINVGITLDAPPTDFDNVSRPQGSSTDVGAYEYKIETGIFNSLDTKSERPTIKQTVAGISIQLPSKSDVEIYAVNGVLIDKSIATTTYSHVLPKGIYLLKINQHRIKFIKK
jgi:parallel beta-helix repeat protein